MLLHRGECLQPSQGLHLILIKLVCIFMEDFAEMFVVKIVGAHVAKSELMLLRACAHFSSSWGGRRTGGGGALIVPTWVGAQQHR